MRSANIYRHRANAMKRSKGFTLIELMAVVAILSILAVIALGAYTDYVVRSKVSEGLAFAAEARTSISEYYYSNKTIPTTNNQAGLSDPADYSIYDYLERLEVTTAPRPGTIVLTFSMPELGTDNMLHLVPETQYTEMTWTCVPPDDNGIARNRVPPNCRN